MQRVNGYFMTNESEMAAKWQIVEDYKKAKERLAVLEEQADKLGELFQEFSRSLRHFTGCHPVIQGESVVIIERRNSSTGSTVIPLSHFSAEKIRSLIEDLSKTREEKKRLRETLKSSGLDVEPYSDSA